MSLLYYAIGTVAFLVLLFSLNQEAFPTSYLYREDGNAFICKEVSFPLFDNNDLCFNETHFFELFDGERVTAIGIRDVTENYKKVGE